MKKHLAALSTLVLLSAACVAQAQEVIRAPLPEGHLLIGSWRVEVPGTQCHEVYTIKPNGTMSVTSAAQAAESEFQIDLQPSAKGFYKWVDKITQDNGKPDCMGGIMEVGHVATNFILMHPSGRAFLMCQTEDLSACLGPFRRLGEGV